MTETLGADRLRYAGIDAFDLRGTSAVVVGASEGIGAALAVGLAAAGSAVILGGRSAQKLENTASDVSSAGELLGVHEVDLRSPERIHEFSESVIAMHGCPTILVNSAGYTKTASAFEITSDEWDHIHDVQLRAPFLMSKEFGRAMASLKYGKIINMSSTWAVTVAPLRSAYCAAKAGLSHLTSALAVEWAPHGIRVNAIAPTATRTPGVARRLAEDSSREKYLQDRIPLGRLLLPEELVGAAVFLACRASDYVTGHTLFVDGGWRTAK